MSKPVSQSAHCRKTPLGLASADFIKPRVLLNRLCDRKPRYKPIWITGEYCIESSVPKGVLFMVLYSSNE